MDENVQKFGNKRFATIPRLCGFVFILSKNKWVWLGNASITEHKHRHESKVKIKIKQPALSSSASWLQNK